MRWIQISYILCLFGCFKDFRPSDSFVVDYLTGWKNFTVHEVNHNIYPVTTYSYLLTLIVIFLITDFIRYKPIIVLCGLSGTLATALVIVGKTVPVIQISGAIYGLHLSTEIAYYTYIFAKVDKSHYQAVTSYTKAASLFGRSMSGIIAQLTASYDLLNYNQLNYLSLLAIVIATLWSVFLPSVHQSVYFHRVSISDNDKYIVTVQKASNQLLQSSNQNYKSCDNRINDTEHDKMPYKSAYTLLWEHFVQAYTNYYIIKWSAWWALSTCGYLLVATYVQLLWQSTEKPGDKIYNGAVNFLFAILSAISVFIIATLQLNWVLLGDIICSLFAFFEGVLILACCYSYNIWFSYAAYIIFAIIYYTILTIASFEVAKYICEDSHGLIFGINMFLALLMQSLMTFIILNIFILDIREQYYIYGIYFIILATIYFILAVINYVRSAKYE